MSYAIIENGIVINIVESSESFAKSQGWVLLPNDVTVGWEYDGTSFSPPMVPDPEPYYIPTYILRQRAESVGVWEALTDYLVQYPPLMLKVLTLETGVDPKDPDLLAGFNTLNVPQSVQDYLLSDPSLGV